MIYSPSFPPELNFYARQPIMPTPFPSIADLLLYSRLHQCLLNLMDVVIVVFGQFQPFP